MVRRAIVIAGLFPVVLGGWASASAAGESSASFNVGITIGGGQAANGQHQDRQLRYTWSAAAISIQQAGYEDIERVAAGSKLYWFEAERGGRRYRIAVSISTGEIVRVDES